MKGRAATVMLVVGAFLVGAVGAVLWMRSGASGPAAHTPPRVVVSQGGPPPANFVGLPAGTRIRVQHIELFYAGMPNAPPAITRSKEETLKLAEELRAKAVSGADFAELVRTHSDHSGAAKGREYGPIDRSSLPKPLSDVAFALQPGEVSQVVQTPGPIYLFKRIE